MQSVIYDVAVSVDGYIAGPDADVSRFPHEGSVVTDYFERLSQYTCCLMGRRTYEFGYAFGLKPGQNPYPHMRSFVFSSTIELPQGSAVEVVRDGAADVVRALREAASGPIYLCGGGAFAGALLAHGLIDTLRLKRAPIVLGGGTPLFAGNHVPHGEVTETTLHPNGVVYQAFKLS